MPVFKYLLTSALVLALGCKSLLPTPLLIGELVELNDKTHELYVECLEAGVYSPETETCRPELLESNIEKTRNLAKQFVAQDIRQPHGYDIYLQVTLIYLSIAQRIDNDYSEAERIARQFFEVQKASSGLQLDKARYYWVIFTTENTLWRKRNGEFSLSTARRAELLMCLAEGILVLEKMQPGPEKIRLYQSVSILGTLTRIP